MDGMYGLDADSGLIGMLARDEIDLAVADFSSTQMPSRSMAAAGLTGIREYWKEIPVSLAN